MNLWMPASSSVEPSTPQVTVFGDGAFGEVTKVKDGHQGQEP